MRDEEFIDRTQKENPDSVSQIDIRIVHTCYILRNQFLVLRTPEQTPIGYLLHSPIHPDEPFKLDAICVPVLLRHCGYGRHLFDQLIARAKLHGALEIRLTCPIDLPANQFFEHMGMLETRHTREASGRKRLLNCWRLHIQPKSTPQDRSRWRDFRQMGPRSPLANGR